MIFVPVLSSCARAGAGARDLSTESRPPSKRANSPLGHHAAPLTRLGRPRQAVTWTPAVDGSAPAPPLGATADGQESPAPAVPAAPGPVRSSFACRRMDAWGDVCIYRDVCFPLGDQAANRPDGGMRFFWGPEGNTAGYRAPFPLGDVQTGYVAPRERVSATACSLEPM